MELTGSDAVRCVAPGTCAVRVHDVLPLRLPGLFHWARELPDGARGAVAQDRQCALSRSFQVLAEDLRRRLRHGRGLRHRHVLSVRHELVRLLEQGRAHHRAADGLRSADGVLPRSGVSRRHAVRDGEGRQGPALLCNLHGRLGYARLGDLDHQRQQLDADAGRVCHECKGPVRSGRLLVADLLQPELSRTGSSIRSSPRISPPRSWSAAWARGICSKIGPILTRESCFPWRCGWPPWWRRCKSWPETRRD